MKYWIFITNEDNWKIIRDNEIYGFNEKTKRDSNKLSVGDLVVIYIKGKLIGGIFEIISLNEQTKIKFKESDYPYKIKLRKIFVPNHPLEFTKDMINQISIFKNKIRWGTILMGRATKEIEKTDFHYIKKILKN